MLQSLTTLKIMWSSKKPLAFTLLMGLGVFSFIFGNWNGLRSHLIKYTGSTFRAMVQSRKSISHQFIYAESLLKNLFVLEYKYGQDLQDSKLIQTLQHKIVKEGIISNMKQNPIVVKDAKGGKLVLGENIPEIKQQHIIIVTTWRSGSTFLGSLLNTYPGTFYSYEPLHYLQNGLHIFFLDETHDTLISCISSISSFRFHGLNKTGEETKALQILSDVFKCQPELGYFQHAHSQNNRPLFEYNFRFWNLCSGFSMGEAACFIPNFTSSFCPRFPIHLTKSVRVRLGQVIQMMNDDGVFKENLKMVLLIRDPRAVMNSRNTMDWCASSPCKDVHSLCEGMEQDYNNAMTLKQKYPEKIHLVRYEDLSLDPFGVTDEILSFLKLPKMPQIENFLETHTGLNRQEMVSNKGQNVTFKEIKQALEKKGNPFGTTVANSRAVPFLWTQTMAEKKMFEVQNVCKKAMDLFGYRRLKNSQDFKVDSIDLLTKTREEIWPSKSRKM